MPIITSRRHPFVQRCRELAHGRGRPDEVLLDGPHLAEEALGAGVPLVGVLTDGRELALAAHAASAGVPVFEATASVIAAASPVQHPAGIVAIARWTPQPAQVLIGRRPGPIVSLVAVQDPGNVGGIIRSADALGAAAVLTLDGTADPGSWKALRAAMGSTFRLPVGTGHARDMVAAARAKGVLLVASVALGGIPLGEWSPPETFVLCVGNEGAGLPEPLVAGADVRVTVPMRPGIDSLNVGIGTALVLWEAVRQRRAKGR